jgi:CoA:oxalate CoA-transferase
VPCSPLNDVASLMADPQVAEREMLVELVTREGTRLKVAGSPIKFAGGPEASFVRAPELDEHRSALLAELGYVPTDPGIGPP